MLNIGELYLQHKDGQTRLCADITLNGRGTTLWFGVDEAQGAYLCSERSDAFIMTLLPMAMRTGQDIEIKTPMSERLHYQLENYLIPTLCSVGDLYHPVAIHGPLTSAPVKNRGAVGTGFSGGVDSLYTILTHGKDSAYPLTHLAVLNLGVFEASGYQESFRKACAKAQQFADEAGLQTVFLDSNYVEALPERYLDVYAFRLLGGAMALQGLFSHYLLSSGHDAANFKLDLHNTATYDLLTVHCAQTESLTVCLPGVQANRCQKLEALSEWPVAHRWLHPCFRGTPDGKNCGHCKKCTCDLITLYALGTLDRFSAVFDIPAFKRAIPQRIGFALVNRDNDLHNEALKLLERKNIPIPPAAYVFEKQFRTAMKNLEEQ